MPDLVLSPVSSTQIEQFMDHPAHMLMLIGPNGIGKMAIAQVILEHILVINPGQVQKNPYSPIVSPIKGTISIDAVRELQRFMNLKTTGKSELRRSVIIEHADKLTIEAQNALLKLMEEPPADTVIVMTVNSSQVLLPTMYSRSQIITIRKPTKDKLLEHFTDIGHSSAAVEQAYILTDGLPGLMNELISSNEKHPLSEAVDNAKQIIRLSRYDRLCLVNDLAKDKPKLRDLLFALQRISQTGLAQTISSEDKTKNIKRWHNILRECITAEKELELNASAKVLLTNLFLTI